MNDPNQPNQTLTKADGNQLQRTQSRSSTNAAASGSKPLQSAAPAAASSNRDRRASLAQSRMRSTENVNNNDIGIETIEQMLQRSAKSETLKHGKSYSNDDGHNGFFSLPLPDTDGSENPMFSPGALAAARRSSDGKENTKTDNDISPGETVGRTTNAEKGQDSQEKSRETTPVVINYRHVPGPVADPTAKPAMPVVETRDGNIKQPKPRSANKADKLDLLANSTDPDENHDVQAPAHAATYLEGDSAPGEGGLICPIDIGGIVRLSQAGSMGSGASSSKSRNSKASASLSAALKNVPVSQSYAQNKANVQNYLAGQANTINHPDPNAPTPSPAQNADMDEEEAERYTPEGEADWGTSDTSLSVRDSSDAATGSCAANSDNLDVEDVTEGSVDEPFVTFRFEHVSTEDGHHVVVGREGQLQKCEDEVSASGTSRRSADIPQPITTPGAVQGFGVMIVLEEDYETGNLTVRQVSEVRGCEQPVGHLMISRIRPICWVSRHDIFSVWTASRESCLTVRRIFFEITSNFFQKLGRARQVWTTRVRRYSFLVAMESQEVISARMSRRQRLPTVDGSGHAGALYTARHSRAGTRKMRTASQSFLLTTSSLSWSWRMTLSTLVSRV